jgi:hypothetical protein
MFIASAQPKGLLAMFGIILGTLCLIALFATIRRERYYRRHGYPQYRHGHHGCGYGHHHHYHPDMPPQAPAATPTPSGNPEGSAS